MSGFFALAVQARQLGASELHFKLDTSFMALTPEGQNECPAETWICMAQCERRYNQYLPDEVSHVSVYKANGRSGEEALRNVVRLMEGDPPHAVRERRSTT